MPPTNHFAKGGFHSSVFFHGVNHETCSRASFAQSCSGLFAPSFRSAATVFLLQFARFANSARGANRRFSFSKDSMSATHTPSRIVGLARGGPGARRSRSKAQQEPLRDRLVPFYPSPGWRSGSCEP